MKKYIIGVIVAFSILAVPASTLAAGLTAGQVGAIISLLQAFGADQSVINSVQIALDGGTITNSPFGIITESSLPFDDKLLDLGVKVTRYSTSIAAWGSIEKTKGIYDWSQTDSLVSATYKNNIEILLTVRSFNSWDQGGSLTGNQKYPKDINAYTKFLKTMVERYDGDGINDASGSPIVEYFQIENEVDGNFWDDTPEKYAQLLTISYKTVKEANPNAKVAIAGIASARGFYKFYVPVLNALTEKSFDVFDIHWYGKAEEYKKINADDFKVFISDLKTRLSNYGYSNIPLWMTETGTYGGVNVIDAQGRLMPEQSEKIQASNLIKRYAYFISNGIDVVMWFKMVEEHHIAGALGKPNDYFENTGLINNPANSDGLSHKKLAYYTYKKMVETLDGLDWNDIKTIQESDGVYIYKFTKNEKSIWVAWNDNAATKTVNLNVGSAINVKVTEAVPKYISGKDITDYNSAFNTEPKTAQSGQITLTLKDIPIFVEDATTTPPSTCTSDPNAWYLNRYPDVKTSAYGTMADGGKKHFCAYGKSENRENCFAADACVVVLPNTSPTITTGSLPSGKTNRAYAASVGAAVVSEVGGNYFWSASGLPNGLSIAGCAAAICRNNAKITGTPTAGGNFTVTVTVTAGGKSSSKTFSLFIDTCDCSPDGSENPTTGACVGNQKGTNTRVYTCDCHWEVNWSKEVDNCSKTECLDGYTPFYTAAGMICTKGTGDLAITTPSPLPSGTVEVSYPATTLSATGGSGSYVWSFATEPGCFIPPGLSINSSGVITGTPTTSGGSYICIKVSSGVVNTFKKFLLSIAASASASGKNTTACANTFCSGTNSKLTEISNGVGRSSISEGWGPVCCDGAWWVDTRGSNWYSACSGLGSLQSGGWYTCNSI